MEHVRQQFSYKDCIGRNVKCDDGAIRRVVQICGSNAYPWKAIINERDPDSKMGYFVSLLSLSCQMLGKPLPSKAQEAAFARMIRAFGYTQAPKPRLHLNDKGLIVPTTVN